MSVSTKQDGFTIVELMVATALTAILLAAVYNMFITSTSVFQTQEDLATAQYQLQTALERIQADLRRAGFGSTPNSNRDPLFCADAATTYHGVIVHDGAGQDQIRFPTSNTYISPDELILLGNFTMSRTVPGLASSSANEITLLVTSKPLENPYDPDNFQMTMAEFQAIFPLNRLVAIRNSYGKTMIRQVTSAAYPILGFSSLSGGMGSNCGVEGTASAVQVSPVDIVRYRIALKHPEDQIDASTHLVREYIGFDGKPLNVSALVVADDVVDFQIWFMFRSVDSSSIIDDDTPADFESNLAIPVDGTAAARPDLIRSAILRLAVRTELEHSDIVHRPRNGDADRLTTFDVNGRPTDGAAPVVSLTGEVEIPNFSLRDLGPW